jgi:hypothetical protein
MFASRCVMCVNFGPSHSIVMQRGGAALARDGAAPHDVCSILVCLLRSLMFVAFSFTRCDKDEAILRSHCIGLRGVTILMSTSLYGPCLSLHAAADRERCRGAPLGRRGDEAAECEQRPDTCFVPLWQPAEGQRYEWSLVHSMKCTRFQGGRPLSLLGAMWYLIE